MHTHAVYGAMDSLRSRGWAVLRFNFRGVGLSEGAHDEGRGERADARAALETLRERWPGLPVVMGGFSFGAWVGLSVGVEQNTEGLLGIGMPYSLYDFSEIERSPRPKAVVQAAKDQFAPGEVIEKAVGRMKPPVRLWIVGGNTTHLFTENLGAYREAVEAAAGWLESELGVPGGRRGPSGSKS
jgi:alpha/beta superfamily hydrolase